MRFIKAKTRISNVPDAIVDDDMFAFLSQYKWNVTRKKGTTNYYYHARINGKWTKMHALILNLQNGQMVDHRNHITHDNQKENLCIADNSTNSHNRKKFKGESSYKGVSRKGKRWRSTIRVHQKTIHVGVFDSEQEAAMAYDRSAKQYFGNHASTNF